MRPFLTRSPHPRKRQERPKSLAELRYRVVCYEIEGDQQTKILDATGRGFIAVTGTIDENNTMHGNGTHAGPLTLRRRLASLIADDEQLAN